MTTAFARANDRRSFMGDDGFSSEAEGAWAIPEHGLPDREMVAGSIGG